MAERAVPAEPAVEVDGGAVRREIEIEAAPDEVFEALATEQGREAWLGEPEREVDVEVVEAPGRLVWWWRAGDEPATRVEFEIVAVPGGSRVAVTEFEPDFPISLLARSFGRVAA
jgi:uncharacterized protein YndB with AHSA1/START domain